VNPAQDVCDDVKLNIVGLIQRTPENGIEWRTPSIFKYQNLYRYIHRRFPSIQNIMRRPSPVN